MEFAESRAIINIFVEFYTSMTCTAVTESIMPSQ